MSYNGNDPNPYLSNGTQPNAPPAHTTDPTVNDDASLGYGIGSYWVNEANDTAWVSVDDTVGVAVWVDITASGGGGPPFPQKTRWETAPITIDDDEETGWGAVATIGGKSYDPATKSVLSGRKYFENMPETATGPEVGHAFSIARIVPKDRVAGSDINIRIHWIQNNDTNTGNVDWNVGTVVTASGETVTINFSTDVVQHIASQTAAVPGVVYGKGCTEFTLSHATDPFSVGDEVHVVIARNSEGAADTYGGAVYVGWVEFGWKVTDIGSA